MYDSLQSYLLDVVSVLVTSPITVGDSFHWANLLAFILLGYVSYRLYERGRRTSFWKFLFPESVYLHPSAKVDYGIYPVNLLISPLILVAAGVQTWVSIEVAEALVALNGQALIVGNWSAWTFGLFIVGYTMIADFSVYLIHRFHHHAEVFWPIHALHHSAEVLTPVMLFRKHPLWNLMASTLHAIFTGVFQGAFIFVFYGGPAVEVLFGINTIYVLYNFLGANLRHSHIWLSWGKPLSYVFISPAMHQVHHDPKRMHMNFGEMFALWDWIFGTLYIPKGKEEFAIGLGEANPHQTLARAYWVPLVEVWFALRKRLQRGFHQTRPRGESD